MRQQNDKFIVTAEPAESTCLHIYYLYLDGNGEESVGMPGKAGGRRMRMKSLLQLHMCVVKLCPVYEWKLHFDWLVAAADRTASWAHSSFIWIPISPAKSLGLIAHENVFMLRIKFSLPKPSSFGQTERKRCKFASIKNGSSTLSNCEAIVWLIHWKHWRHRK